MTYKINTYRHLHNISCEFQQSFHPSSQVDTYPDMTLDVKHEYPKIIYIMHSTLCEYKHISHSIVHRIHSTPLHIFSTGRQTGGDTCVSIYQHSHHIFKHKYTFRHLSFTKCRQVMLNHTFHCQ